MQAGAAVADLRAGDERRSVAEAGGRSRAAGALRDVLVDLAVLVGPGPKPFTEATIMRGLSLWMCSQVSPMRSSAPGAKFSTSTSQCFTRRSRISLPLGFLESIVIERLRAVEHGEIEAVGPFTSRSWPRVMSPTPGRSTLITSAPM